MYVRMSKKSPWHIRGMINIKQMAELLFNILASIISSEFFFRLYIDIMNSQNIVP